MKRFNFKYLTLPTLIVVLVCAFAGTILASATDDSDHFMTQADVISAYLESMKGSDSALRYRADDTPLYTDVNAESESIMDLADAEAQGLLNTTAFSSAENSSDIISSVRETVLMNFGETAWDNANYSLVEIPTTDGHTGYFLRNTAEEITFDEYLSLNNDFWNALANDGGITIEDIFATPPNGEITDPVLILGQEIYLENYDKEPAVIGTIPSYDSYEVQLTFNGNSVGNDGSNNYKFVITNESGAWQVSRGLAWDAPLDEVSVEACD